MKIKLTYKILRDFTLFGTILMFIISIITFILYLNGKSELRLLDFAITINFFGLYSCLDIISKKEEEIKFLAEIDKFKDERIDNFKELIKCYDKLREGLNTTISLKEAKIQRQLKLIIKQIEVIENLRKENNLLEKEINNSKN